MPDFAPRPMQLTFEKPGNYIYIYILYIYLFTGGTHDYRGAHQMSSVWGMS